MRSSSDRSGHLVRGPWRFVSPPYWLGPGGACSSGANCFVQVTCAKTRADRRIVLEAGGSCRHGTLPESIGRIAAGLVSISFPDRSLSVSALVPMAMPPGDEEITVPRGRRLAGPRKILRTVKR